MTRILRICIKKWLKWETPQLKTTETPSATISVTLNMEAKYGNLTEELRDLFVKVTLSKKVILELKLPK
jgi:hypothetical protein